MCSSPLPSLGSLGFVDPIPSGRCPWVVLLSLTLSSHDHGPICLILCRQAGHHARWPKVDWRMVGGVPALWCLTFLLISPDVRIPTVPDPPARALGRSGASHAARTGLWAAKAKQRRSPTALLGGRGRHFLLPAAKRWCTPHTTPFHHSFCFCRGWLDPSLTCLSHLVHNSPTVNSFPGQIKSQMCFKIRGFPPNILFISYAIHVFVSLVHMYILMCLCTEHSSKTHSHPNHQKQAHVQLVYTWQVFYSYITLYMSTAVHLICSLDFLALEKIYNVDLYTDTSFQTFIFTCVQLTRTHVHVQ